MSDPRPHPEQSCRHVDQYVEVGRRTTKIDGCTINVGKWRRWKGEIPEFRDFISQPGYGGTDYGLTDAELARYAEEAKAKVRGRRLSWSILAWQAITADHAEGER